MLVINTLWEAAQSSWGWEGGCRSRDPGDEREGRHVSPVAEGPRKRAGRRKAGGMVPVEGRASRAWWGLRPREACPSL